MTTWDLCVHESASCRRYRADSGFNFVTGVELTILMSSSTQSDTPSSASSLSSSSQCVGRRVYRRGCLKLRIGPAPVGRRCLYLGGDPHLPHVALHPSALYDDVCIQIELEGLASTCFCGGIPRVQYPFFVHQPSSSPSVSAMVELV
jgi:hypothetical protein